MPFNSLQYFLFLPVVYLLFYLVPDRARWCVLLAASLLFYSALKVPYLLVVLTLVALTTYGFGIRLAQAAAPGARRALLWGGVATNLTMLILMKYLPFLAENLAAVSTSLALDHDIEPLESLVAIGVSYYTFQAISYLIDIYLEIQEPEQHFGHFALYLCFFPKLLQGPIERAGDLMPQLKNGYSFSYDNMRLGALLFACGLFKKVVLADRLGLYVDTVYSDVHAYLGLPLLLATYAYSFQIYLDFSGYTDMALGSALLFNINLTPNFNRPYLATSVADFWRRWHITFSRGILDYIFKPLQMQWRNLGNWGTALALVAAFLVSGIWHGASWGFVIWGGLHGLYMGASILYRPYQKKLHQTLGLEKTRLQRVLQIMVTFHLVSLAWIFFRAPTLGDAWYVLNNMLDLRSSYLSLQSSGAINYLKLNVFMGHGAREFTVLISFLAILFLLQNRDHALLLKSHVLKRWLAYYLILIATWLFHVSSSQFIYFNF